jgi:hypothetical protein
MSLSTIERHLLRRAAKRTTGGASISLGEIIDDGMAYVGAASKLVSLGLCTLSESPGGGLVITAKGREALEETFRRP